MSMRSTTSKDSDTVSSYSSYNEDGQDNVANCIRNRSNFSMVKSFHMMDKKDFNPELLKIYIENDAAPKLKLLLKKIQSLDEKDMKSSGKLHKHLIFTDVNRSAYGAKIIASALASYGKHIIYHPQGKGFSILDDERLLENKGNNFSVLLSKSFYDRPVNVKIRKAILEKFNSRPENVHGDLIRFIILDQGFKEGIDLFDVKYVHLFEPLSVLADEKQAIGRATRFCGQKGLEFHPRYGWPLYVFKYDIYIPEKLQEFYLNSRTLFDLYIKHSNLDMKKIIFASELENATINSAIDRDLTKAIHLFKVEKPEPLPNSTSNRSNVINYEASGGKKYVIKAPPKIMKLQQMKTFITSKFSRMRYPRMVLENNCKNGGGINGNNVTFTPTQDVIRHYFQPESAYKGILLHHSVGTGKTCTAIATATTSFDIENYTILWVTRHTLKADIWKNMYGQVCSLDVQEQIKNGLKLPNKIGNKFKYISKNWLEPISYKQFSNMLLGKNKIYTEMVRRNGKEDPLKKTLLIIDEAHKLYSPTVAKSEKPNTSVLEKMIQNSYDKSGKNSVKVMLMTATPFTEDGMEMIKLLNLLRDGDKLPTNFKKFSDKYLNDDGYFTKKGLKSFQDSISGYISYLNRSQDARNFAHPVIQNVYAKLSIEHSQDSKKIDKISIETKNYIKDVKVKIKELNVNANELKTECNNNVKSIFNKDIISMNNDKKYAENKCKELNVKERKGCKENVVIKFKELLNDIKQNKVMSMEKCKDINNTIYNNNSAMKNMRSKIEEMNNELNMYNKRHDAIKDVNNKKKDIRVQIKELNKTKNTLKSKLKNLRIDIKYKKNLISIKLIKLKEIDDKNKRNIGLKEFRLNNPLVLEVKELVKEFKELKAHISKLNSQVNVMKMVNGIKAIRNISQDYAITKFCNNNI